MRPHVMEHVELFVLLQHGAEGIPSLPFPPLGAGSSTERPPDNIIRRNPMLLPDPDPSHRLDHSRRGLSGLAPSGFDM